MLKAIIMAGGEGTRLRPLTLSMPKPLVPVASQPAMSHILRLLRDHGVGRAAVTLRYMGEMISDYYGDEAFDIALDYFYEDEPLGTAGGVKAASGFARDSDEPFIVISGDTVCEIDLSAALAFHKQKQADLTMVLTKVEVPLEYGVVMCNSEGRVTQFLEKPSWGQVFSDTVNTGIYIISPHVLDLIPDGEYDFGRQLLPKMLSESRALYGFYDPGYWCDIGNLKTYLECNMRFSDGQPVIGDDCIISPDAVIMRSVILDNVRVSGGAVLDGAVICGDCVIGENTAIGSGAVIGAGCSIGRGAKIGKKVKIFPDIEIGDGENVTEDLISQPVLRNTAAVGLADAASALRYGEALAAVCGRIGIMHDRSEASRVTAAAVSCGVWSGGGHGCELGEGFEAMASFAARQLMLPYVLFCSADGHALFDRSGDEVTDALDGRLGERMNTGTTLTVGRRTRSVRFGGIEYLYAARLTGLLEDLLVSEGSGTVNQSRMKDLTLTFNDTYPSRIAAAILNEAGASCTIGDGGLAHFTLGGDGRELTVSYDQTTLDGRRVNDILIKEGNFTPNGDMCEAALRLAALMHRHVRSENRGMIRGFVL